MLAALARARARATFFVIGERVRAHPGVLAALGDAGHEVQLHCWRHVRHTEMTEHELATDTDAALDELRRRGVVPRCWRPPWGVCTAATRRVARERGLTLVGWDVDTHDWRGDRAGEMSAAIAGDLRPSSVVLMHDGIGPGATRADCRETAALVPRLVETLRARSLRPALLSELPA